VVTPRYPSIRTTSRGGVAYEQGDLAEAARYAEQAYEIRVAKLEPGHALLGMSRNNLGEIALASHRDDEAEEHFRQAMSIFEPILGDTHPMLAYPLTGMGELALRRDEPEAALAPLERALSLRESAEVEPADLAATRFALARALWRARRDRKRATELARLAVDGYAAGRNHDKSVEAAEWLRRVTR
jgi:tetratricopeptide (TPR) repeat protein